MVGHMLTAHSQERAAMGDQPCHPGKNAAGQRAWTAEQVRTLGVRTDLATAASILGMGRTKAYDLARRGTFPVPMSRVGSRYVVPTAPLLKFLGVDDGPQAPGQRER